MDAIAGECTERRLPERQGANVKSVWDKLYNFQEPNGATGVDGGK